MPGLIGPDTIRAAADAALELKGVDGVEVLLMHEWGGLTRFASSSIHQSTWREDTGLRVRVISKGRVGVAATNQLSPEGAREAAASAKEMAEVVSPDPLFPGLAPKAEVPEKDAYDEATASVTPEDRADGVAALVGHVADGFHAAGSYETQGLELAIANTEGQFCYQPVTQASVTALVSGGEGGAGYVESWAVRAGELDLEAIGRRAGRKAADSQNPRDLDPGHYEVVLEPAAVATLIAFLAYLGFSGRALTEGRSCLTGKQGQQVASPLVTIVDDATTPGTSGATFDFEGTPKRRVELIRDGVFLDGVYDRRSARQAGKESTGHALPPPSPDGAFPMNLSVSGGDASIEDMVAATERGLLVTRFHYSNVAHPTLAVITGMTRDGTWLIENGEIKHPVKNFRFTQSILEALTNTEMVSKDTEMVSEFFFSASRVPALKVSKFHLTGRSDH
ncbi:MAG: TldD/PmbA family protein [Actinomycetota bacterium]|nr:TldD/PmbA family protein [Actinomycetota bacterium]